MKKEKRFTRRGFLQLLGAAALDLLILGIGSAGYGYFM
jgi:hypothetical protein